MGYMSFFRKIYEEQTIEDFRMLVEDFGEMSVLLWLEDFVEYEKVIRDENSDKRKYTIKGVNYKPLNLLC